MDSTTTAAPNEQQARISDFHTVQDLGSTIQCLAALIRAAINADSEDSDWLLSLAEGEVEKAQQRYERWGDTPREAA